ncbi:Secreted protein OS=Streptomyces alboniger OX=132473 GN=CP975_29740 PE=4 SV=1 [Streptomyces alboniger]
MNDDVRNIVLGVVAAGLSAALGWLTRTYLWKRKLRRKQTFFGLPDSSESLLVVNRGPAAPEPAVHRYDVFALLELAALIKDCSAHAQVVPHDAAHQGFGERTEFCVGGPGVQPPHGRPPGRHAPRGPVNVDPEPSPDRAAFQIGAERYRVEAAGSSTPSSPGYRDPRHGTRPAFLFCGQPAITNQAATRYLARHHEQLTRKHGTNAFVLLLKVVNSAAYGPDVVELVADVTPAATTPPPAPALRNSHRASQRSCRRAARRAVSPEVRSEHIPTIVTPT